MTGKANVTAFALAFLVVPPVPAQHGGVPADVAEARRPASGTAFSGPAANDPDAAITTQLNRAIVERDAKVYRQNAEAQAEYEKALAENAKSKAAADAERRAYEARLSAFNASSAQHELDMANWREKVRSASPKNQLIGVRKAPPAAAGLPERSKEEIVVTGQNDRKICKYEAVTGSIIGRKICKTPKSWNGADQATAIERAGTQSVLMQESQRELNIRCTPTCQ